MARQVVRATPATAGAIVSGGIVSAAPATDVARNIVCAARLADVARRIVAAAALADIAGRIVRAAPRLRLAGGGQGRGGGQRQQRDFRNAVHGQSPDVIRSNRWTS